MERLTYKHSDGFYLSKAACTDDLKNKLGQLEDLFEKLFGDVWELEIIQLLVEAHTNGVIRPVNPRKLKEGFMHREVRVDFQDGYLYDMETGKELYLNDFGKLWGLSEEDFK